ncbi:hypothetical protein [Nocardioides sp. SYSU DS0663]|uniref:hypothetical protein n=1 Tax=Nocardioides sp. SYSU DS0663 TaxID=3416445 RepID=UPI003F4C53BE
MKKIIAGLATATMMSAGLIGVSTAPASADCNRGYQGTCESTDNKGRAPGSIKRGNKPKIKVRITAPVEGVEPTGRVKIIYRHVGSKFEVIKRKDYDGPKKYIGPRFTRAGEYKVIVVFIPEPGTPFKRSKETYRITIK